MRWDTSEEGMQVNGCFPHGTIVDDPSRRRRLGETSNPTSFGSFIVYENKHTSMF